MTKALAVLALTLGACDLYGGGGDDVCATSGGGTRNDGIGAELRDPSTGQCSSFGGDCYCDPVCGGECPPCTTGAEPDWGLCYGACNGVAEQDCFLQSGCIAAYLDTGTEKKFWGCWDVVQTGPIQGQCLGLDAHECLRHDDCVANYTNTPSTYFSSCGPELTPGDPGTCTGTVTCTQPAPQCPTGTVPGIKNGCWSGYCIPQSDCPVVACETLTTEATCIARTDCVPIYQGTNCTCDMTGCSCQVLTYDHCETP